ncbi:MAG: DUF1456 family protein [Lachnospiraceae bacterium]|nr:DUF1456 family protein [Lachnospiraceae bacterium]
MKMINNDILIRLRYALDIKDTDMVEIFKLGGIEIAKEDVQKMLYNPKKSDDSVMKEEEFKITKDMEKCSNVMLESFLNGFIVFKRGVQESRTGEEKKQVLMIKDNKNVNNIMLKKVKIALDLSSEDMIDILELAGVTVSKGELSAVFRKEGHRNYKECGDRYARNFLKGLAIRYRK